MIVNNPGLEKWSGKCAGGRSTDTYRDKVYIMATKSYTSDTTNFIREFLEKNPQVVDKQRKARSTWWDRPQDRAQREKFEESKVPKKPYEYY